MELTTECVNCHFLVSNILVSYYNVVQKFGVSKVKFFLFFFICIHFQQVQVLN